MESNSGRSRDATLPDQNALRARDPNIVGRAFTTECLAEPQTYDLRKTLNWQTPPGHLWTTLTGMLLLLTTNTGARGRKTKPGRWLVLPCQQ